MEDADRKYPLEEKLQQAARQQETEPSPGTAATTVDGCDDLTSPAPPEDQDEDQTVSAPINPSEAPVAFAHIIEHPELAARFTSADLAEMRRIFGSVMGSAPCPCGSGKVFLDCCRDPYRKVMEIMAAASAPPKEPDDTTDDGEHTGEGPDKPVSGATLRAKVQAFVMEMGHDWAIVLSGSRGNARHIVMTQATGEQLPLDFVADVLMSSHTEAVVHLATASAFAQLQKVMGTRQRPGFRGPPAQGRRH